MSFLAWVHLILALIITTNIKCLATRFVSLSTQAYPYPSDCKHRLFVGVAGVCLIINLASISYIYGSFPNNPLRPQNFMNSKAPSGPMSPSSRSRKVAWRRTRMSNGSLSTFPRYVFFLRWSWSFPEILKRSPCSGWELRAKLPQDQPCWHCAHFGCWQWHFHRLHCE